MEKKTITIRPVEGFDPYDYIFQQRDEISGKPVPSDITGKPKEYLLVKAQKVWFQNVFPEGSIQTTYIHRDDGQHQFHARIYRHRDDALKATAQNPDAGALATADALRLPVRGEKYAAFESAQTMAISYALENAGFGSEIALQLACLEKGENAAAAPEPVKAEDIPVPDKETIPSFELPSAMPEAKSEGDMDDAVKAFGEMLGGESLPEMKEEPERETMTETAKEPDSEERPKKTAPKKKEKVSKAEKGEEKCEEDVSIEDAGMYVITADDVVGVPALENYVGKTMDEIGKRDVKVMLQFVGDRITANLKAVAENYVKEE